MIIPAAKSTNAHFENAKRGLELCVWADRVGGRWVGSGSYICAEDSSLLSFKSCGTKCESKSGVDHFCVWFPLFKGSAF